MACPKEGNKIQSFHISVTLRTESMSYITSDDVWVCRQDAFTRWFSL